MIQRREQRGLPPHHVHHVDGGARHYLITAACYEHQNHIGHSSDRMTDFMAQWLECLRSHATAIPAWIILPNHYHAVVHTHQVLELLADLGRLHGRTSFQWNKEENTRGRKVWYHALETVMKSDAHYHASVNYVLSNAVKHGHAAKWTDWPWSNAAEHLHRLGEAEALRRWKAYPVDGYGDTWDH